MTVIEILLACTCVLNAILLIIIIIGAVKRKKDRSTREVEGVVIKDGVRLTKSSEVETVNGDIKISLNKGDFVLMLNKTYTVGKKADLLAGKYTVLSANESSKALNIRIGDYVREYHHKDAIVLADGDQICAVSENVVLR